MKTNVILLMLIFSVSGFAQNFSGKVTYQTKVILNDLDSELGGDPQLASQIQEAMRKASEKTYFLEFTKDESLYTEEEQLAPPSAGGNVMVSFSSTSAGKFYKNLKENFSLLESDYLDKVFLIKDSLHTSGWVLTSETKKVGNYIAYKATKTVKAKNYFSEDEDDEKSSDLLSSLNNKEPKDLIYTAWYTPEIPTPNGPENFGGLPGLILELHTPNKVYLCSEIVLNPKKPIKIKVPKGKTISQKKYDDLVEEQFKNMPKTKDGKGRISVQTIEIGG